MNRLIGAILSFLYALVGAIPWVILSYFGWLASIAGYLIGLLAYKGYVKGNASFDRFGKICLALVILFIVPFAEMVNIFIVGLQEGIHPIVALVGTPLLFVEYIGEFLPNILIGYFMAGLGVYRFFLEPKQELSDI